MPLGISVHSACNRFSWEKSIYRAKQIISNQASQIDIEIPSTKFHRTSLQILIYHLIPPAIRFPGQTVNCSPLSVNDIPSVKVFRDGIGTFFFFVCVTIPLTSDREFLHKKLFPQ